MIFASCSKKPENAEVLNRFPPIFPDYQNVTVPPNIAPLNFKLTDSSENVYVEIAAKGKSVEMQCQKNIASISINKWQQLLESSKGDSLQLTVYSEKNGKWKKYKTFNIYVAKEPIDPYLVYRLIMPGYQTWNEMGIYQRSLSSFEQKAILNSKFLPGTCMNCHSFSQNNPDNMMLHLREVNNGTLLRQNGKLEYLSTKTPETFGNAAFPYWHPSNMFIAYSIDKVRQIFYSKNECRAEVLDMKSDIEVYDIVKNEMFTSPLLFSDKAFEVYPCFSPDGKTLYFCSAVARKLPEEYKLVKYSICSIAFDAEKKQFGTTVDTLVSAYQTGKSSTFPRVSPDGKFMVFNMADCGHSPAYRTDADLYMLDLKTRKFFPLNKLNSNDVESYHTWSSNSRWLIFSSKRIDGLYSTPFIAYMDKNGNPGKPFLLPQESPDFYKTFLFSYNIPELAIKQVSLNRNEVEKRIKEPAKQVLFRKLDR